MDFLGLKDLTEKSMIPLGVVALLLGLSSKFNDTSSQTGANTKAIEQVAQKQDEMNRLILEISNKLARIEGALGRRYRDGK